MASVMELRTSSWAPPFPVYRFTVDQYHRMIQAGILTENDKVELLEGWIVPRMPHNPPHDGTVWLVQTALLSHLPSDWILRVQSAITTPDSEPEPDLVVARGPGLRYFTEHPHPKDIALIVEVSDTTLHEDREEKGRLYARARIPIYWIANLQEACIEVYTRPKVGKTPVYQRRQVFAGSQEIPLIIQGTEICKTPVWEILG